MVATEGMWLGSVLGSLPDVASLEQIPLQGAPFALIVCLDSLRDLRCDTMLERAMRTLGCERKLIGGQVLTTGACLLQLILGPENVFSGYDEVWLFDREPSQPVPDEFSLVGPVPVLEALRRETCEWGRLMGCIAAFGDGNILNYLVRDEGVARCIENEFEAADA